MSKYDPFAFSAVFVSTGPAVASPPRDDRSPLEKAITKLIKSEFDETLEERLRGESLLAKVVDAIHEDEHERNWRDGL